MIRLAAIYSALMLLFPGGQAAAQTPGLPSTMVMKQWIGSGNWTWTLTRRGTQAVYDGVARNHQNGVQSNHVFELRSWDGKTVSLYRPDAGTYTGTVASDGVTINGRTSFGGSNEGWQIVLPAPMVEKVDPAPPETMVEKSDPVRGAAAQAAPGLGARLTIEQWMGTDSWTWTLTRRGNGPVYDAVARNRQNGVQSNHVFELRSFDGRTIQFYRNDAGFYNGTVAADGMTVNGRTSFGVGNEGWRMTLGAAAAATAVPAPARPAASTAPSRPVASTPVPATPTPAVSPPASIASRLTIKQWVGNDSWTWTLTRRDNGTLYDAVARHDQSGGQSNHVFDLRTFDGKTLVFYRNDAGFYNGKVSADGRQVQGTVDFAGGGWSMSLEGGALAAGGAAAASPAGAPAAAPAAGQVVHYRVENLVFKAPDRYLNPRNLHDFMVDFNRCEVRPMVSPAALAKLQIQVHVCRPGSRLTFTQTTTDTGSVVDYDWALLDGGRTVAGAWKMSVAFGPSVGGQVTQ